jgi:hypothetical protein
LSGTTGSRALSAACELRRAGRTPGSKYAGGHRIRVTPVPIPNTEVKPDTADGTARETVWESRSLPAVIHTKTPDAQCQLHRAFLCTGCLLQPTSDLPAFFGPLVEGITPSKKCSSALRPEARCYVPTRVEPGTPRVGGRWSASTAPGQARALQHLGGQLKNRPLTDTANPAIVGGRSRLVSSTSSRPRCASRSALSSASCAARTSARARDAASDRGAR